MPGKRSASESAVVGREFEGESALYCVLDGRGEGGISDWESWGRKREFWGEVAQGEAPLCSSLTAE